MCLSPRVTKDWSQKLINPFVAETTESTCIRITVVIDIFISKKQFQRHQKKKQTREDNKKVIDCYFKSNLTQRGYKKRMMEIWTESVKFYRNQNLTDQAWLILKKGWLSDLNIYEQVNWEEHIQRELLKGMETPNSDSKITTEHRKTSILKQENRPNIELILRITSKQKTTISNLRK